MPTGAQLVTVVQLPEVPIHDLFAAPASRGGASRGTDDASMSTVARHLALTRIVSSFARDVSRRPKPTRREARLRVRGPHRPAPPSRRARAPDLQSSRTWTPAG